MLRLQPACSLLAVALVLTIGGCRSPSQIAGTVRAVGDAGDTITLARPAERVVSLIPATTELLFAIGAGSQVVGRTTWCDFPPAAKSVANLGDGLRPNLEAIVAQRPDLVLLYNSAQNATAVAHLQRLGIAALRLNTDRLDQVARNARLLGRLTGRPAAGDSLAAAFAEAIDTVHYRLDPAPTVFLLAWDQPPMTIGGGSFQSELVARAGGRNVFDDLPTASGPVSIEAVAARDPDLILLFADEMPDLEDRPEWKAVRAVRERRFLRIGGSEFSRPGPRAPAAIHTLADSLRAHTQ